jgi:glutamate racemase
MPLKQTSPVGIFDSGIGGLTVAKAIKDRLPNESLLYFGDTAHLPYGEKSTASIQAYSLKICQFLIDKGCKVIVIACHSASAAAYDLINEHFGEKVLVLNVIDPTLEKISTLNNIVTFGLIGTRQTVGSKVYDRKFEALFKNKKLKSMATPLLVPMIEEGFYKYEISQKIIEKYLKAYEIDGIEALILGCTHFPLIKKNIEKFYNGKVLCIDPSEVVAKKLEDILIQKNLKNENKNPTHHFFVSDYTESFEQATQIFFGDKIYLEEALIWD